jgi:hypothetical protein
MSNGELTELEQAKMELYATRHQLLQQQVNGNLAQRLAYIGQIEADHPGYRWDEASAKLAIIPEASGPA